MTLTFDELVRNGLALTDAALERLLPGTDALPHSIHRAMRHSVFAGGKRLRPLLAIESARMIAGTLPDGVADLGAALEMLHTYSLIHDDLPALDNDDLRRGKPTCHVVYGEAMAILAGDALQTLAYQTLAHLPSSSGAAIQIVKEIALATGTGVGSDGLPPGMIGGQVMDVESEHHTPTPELVAAIHRAKTGALITVSIVTGGIYGGASSDEVAHLRLFGERIGLAFQIVDDVLDVTQSSVELGKTAGKDTATERPPGLLFLVWTRRVRRRSHSCGMPLQSSTASASAPHHLRPLRAPLWNGPTSMLTETDVLEALRVCFDPEVPVNIVDLGLVYRITVKPDTEAPGVDPRFHVHVRLTMRAPNDEREGMLLAQVSNRLAGIPEISSTAVELTWVPPWTADRMSDAARRQLGLDRPLKQGLVEIKLA